MTDIFYTFEYNDECMDLECKTRAELEQWLDEWFAEKFSCEPMRNGESREDEGMIVEYIYDDDGEMVIQKKEKHNLYYEYYHGDFAEHNTYGR